MKISVEAEIDEQEVIGNLSDMQIFDISGMDESSCKDYFGDQLLKIFTLAEIISYHGEAAFLDEIGDEAAIKHFGIDVAE